jgi:mRNA-degrading endonuclease RelE of RelBE toxin-antitoxin system
MGYQLWIEDEARVEIKRLPGHMRQRIHQAVQSLRDEPRPHHSHKLTTPEHITLEVRRLRLDRWRVVYVVDEEWSEVGVLAVRKRPPYDYRDLPGLLAELD